VEERTPAEARMLSAVERMGRPQAGGCRTPVEAAAVEEEVAGRQPELPAAELPRRSSGIRRRREELLDRTLGRSR
jgi:hypothetical protein